MARLAARSCSPSSVRRTRRSRAGGDRRPRMSHRPWHFAPRVCRSSPYPTKPQCGGGERPPSGCSPTSPAFELLSALLRGVPRCHALAELIDHIADGPRTAPVQVSLSGWSARCNMKDLSPSLSAADQQRGTAGSPSMLSRADHQVLGLPDHPVDSQAAPARISRPAVATANTPRPRAAPPSRHPQPAASSTLPPRRSAGAAFVQDLIVRIGDSPAPPIVGAS